jgi:3-dehydro-4-phosphotetronate decarboxylase
MSGRDEIVVAGRQLADAGLSPGSSGNISVRDGDRIIMTPTGSDMGTLDADAMSVLSLAGELLDGPKASKEFPFHRAMYRRDSAVRAVVHVHSPHAAAMSCTAPWHPFSALPPLTPYFVMRVGQTPLIPYASPGDAGQADRIEALPFPFRAVLLQNHGSVTAAASMAAAVDAAVELEEVSRLLLLLGDRPLQLLPEGEPGRLAERYDSVWTVPAP